MKPAKRGVAVCLWVFMELALVSLSVNSYAADCIVTDPQLVGTYDGPCSDGFADGRGRAKGASAEYEGDFRRGMKHGKGIKRWVNGDRYDGEFRDDKRHGFGRYVWGKGADAAGDIYHGGYADDLREGFGWYEWASGDRYTGEWKADKRLGRSVFEARQSEAREVAVISFKRNRGKTLCRYPVADSDIVIKGEVESVTEYNQLRVRVLEVDRRLGQTGAGLAGQVVDVDPLEWQWCRSSGGVVGQDR